jgi:ABC-type glycerol-3-phosphate transport system substrate-binding protein
MREKVMKKVVKKILFGMILVLVLFLVGCGGEETIKADPTPSDDTSVVAAVPAAGNENVKEMVVEQNDDATEEETEETTEEPTSTVKLGLFTKYYSSKPR